MEPTLRVDRVRERMRVLDIDSARQLAVAAGVDNVTVSKVLNNTRPQVSATTVARLATALQCSVDYLLGLSDVAVSSTARLPARGEEMLRVLGSLPMHRREDLLTVATAFAEQDARNAAAEAEFERLLDIIESRLSPDEFDNMMRDLFRAVRSHDKAALDDVVSRYGALQQASSETPQTE